MVSFCTFFLRLSGKVKRLRQSLWSRLRLRTNRCSTTSHLSFTKFVFSAISGTNPPKTWTKQEQKFWNIKVGERMQNKHFHFAFNFLCVFDLSIKKQKKNNQTNRKTKESTSSRSLHSGAAKRRKATGNRSSLKETDGKKKERSEICPWRAQTLTKWDRRGCELNSEGEEKKKKEHKARWDLQMKRREKLNAQVLRYGFISESYARRWAHY